MSDLITLMDFYGSSQGIPVGLVSGISQKIWRGRWENIPRPRTWEALPAVPFAPFGGNGWGCWVGWALRMGPGKAKTPGRCPEGEQEAAELWLQQEQRRPGQGLGGWVGCVLDCPLRAGVAT